MTKPTGRLRGRPPSPAIGRALELVRAGASLADAAREAGCSEATVRRARDREDVSRAPARTSPGPTARRPAKGTPAPATGHRDVKAAAPAPPPPPSQTRPAGGTDADDLVIIDGEIAAVREQLRAARAEGKTHGTGALQKNLLDLIRRRRELRPPPPPDPDEEKRRWKADGDAVIAKIEAGVVAVEVRDAPKGRAA